MYTQFPIFNNEFKQANLKTIKRFTTDYLTKRLTQRGYRIVENGKRADLVLTIKPASIYDLSQSKGYGYYERSLLGISVRSFAYIALLLTPTKNGVDLCTSCYGSSFTKLPIDDMPNDWETLTDAQKKILEAQLMKDIKTAINDALKNTSL